MQDTSTVERIRQKYRALSGVMDERMRRQWAAAEAGAVGCPVGAEVFEGNTADPKTLTRQIETIQERFKLKRVVLVGDRGHGGRLRAVGGYSTA